MENLHWKDELNFATIMPGALFVMTIGTTMMHKLCVDNWASLALVSSTCMHSIIFGYHLSLLKFIMSKLRFLPSWSFVH